MLHAGSDGHAAGAGTEGATAESDMSPAAGLDSPAAVPAPFAPLPAAGLPPPVWAVSPDAGGADVAAALPPRPGDDACMGGMHGTESAPRPSLTCGVGGSCDAETAVAGMLRRLVWKYEAVLPRERVCCVLRGFLGLVQRFAAGNAASAPQEYYPAAVRILRGNGREPVVAVTPTERPAMQELDEALAGSDRDSLAALVSGASDSIACVIGTLVATTVQLIDELEQRVCIPHALYSAKLHAAAPPPSHPSHADHECAAPQSRCRQRGALGQLQVQVHAWWKFARVDRAVHECRKRGRRCATYLTRTS